MRRGEDERRNANIAVALPKLISLVLAETGSKIHWHAVLDAGGEEGAVLYWQGATAVGNGVGREFERLGFTADDA